MSDAISAITATGAKSVNSKDQNEYTDQLAEAVLKKMDKNSDGILSKDEVGFSEEVYSLIDKNGDNKIDNKEIAAAMKGIGQITSGAAGNASVLLSGTTLPSPQKLDSLMGNMAAKRPEQLGQAAVKNTNGAAAVN